MSNRRENRLAAVPDSVQYASGVSLAGHAGGPNAATATIL